MIALGVLVLEIGTAVGSYANTVLAIDNYAGAETVTGTKGTVRHRTLEVARVWITVPELATVA